MDWRSTWAASVGAAALCAAATRFGAPAHLLVLVALAPWLAVLDRARSWRAALACGAALSVALSLLALGWFADAASAYTSLPRAASWALLAAGAPLLEPQLPLAALARFAAARRGAGPGRRFGALAATWFAVEWAFPKLLGDTLGHALQPSAALRQVADLAGAGGVTVLALAANELVLALVVRLAGRGTGRIARLLAPASALAALLTCWAGYGAWRLSALRAAARGDAILVGVVQSAIVDYDRLARERGRYAVVREVLDVHERLSRDLVRERGAELVVWPETVYPTTFRSPRSETGAELDRELEAFAAELGVPLAFGAYDAEGGREYNAAFFLSPDGSSREAYRKAHLFPLTEWAPGVLGGAALRRVAPWMGTWTPGPGPRVVAVDVRGRRLIVGPLLCYDAVRPAHAAAQARQGASLLLALSNDGWFADGPGARLHLLVSTFRAVETRLPLVRATPTGISALVDPSGEVVAAAAPGAREGLLVTVAPGPALRSPFTALLPLLGPASAAVALLAVAWQGSRRR